MYQQNKKNGNLILIKNRRILTRTQQSKEKLKINLTSNHFVQRTPKQKSSKLLKYPPQRKNCTQHKTITHEILDNSMFWKTSKKKKIKTDCSGQSKNHSFEALSPRNYQENNCRSKLYSKSSSKMFGLLKMKIFSHKNLNQGIDRVQSNTSESTLRMNNDNTIQNEIPSNSTQRQNSQRMTQRTYFLKGIKDFTKRFKTQNVEPEQNVQQILKNIYSSRRRKLRLNSNEYSVELRLNNGKKQNKNQVKDNQQSDTAMTTKTENIKSSLKLPKQLMNKIKEKSQKSQAVLSPVNLSFSSDNDNIQRKYFNAENNQKDSNKNQVIIPSNRQKSKTLLSHEMMSKIEQQGTYRQKDFYYQPKIKKQQNEKDSRFLKKQIPQIPKKSSNKILQSKAISIQDIEVVCLSQSLNMVKIPEHIEKNFEVEQKTKQKIEFSVINPYYNSKRLVTSAQQNNLKKKKTKQEKLLKNLQKHKIYENIEQIEHMQEINLTEKNDAINEQIIPNSQKNTNSFSQNLKIQTINNAENKYEKGKISIQKLQKEPLMNKQEQEIQKQKFLKFRYQIQELNCIGQVGGQCSQSIPKKNLTWMIPTLLLYQYCLNFRSEAISGFAVALQKQLCSQIEYRNFIEENQQIKLNISKIYQKAKKKNLLNQETENAMKINFHQTKQKNKYFRTLFNEVVNFVNLSLKQSHNQYQSKQNLYICGIKMIFAFLVILKFEQQSKNQTKVAFNLPQINFQTINESKCLAILQETLQSMKQAFQIYSESIES